VDLERHRYAATRTIAGGNPVFVVIGNQCDRETERQVPQEEGEELARRFGCQFCETSAKTGQNVQRVFADLVRNLREARHAISGAESALQKREERRKKKCVTL
jgi:GTPase KRas protein